MTTRRPAIAAELLRFVRTFTRMVPVRLQVLAALLMLAAGLSEGIGLALLAPLAGLFGAGGNSTGRLGVIVARALGTVGLPVSLPIVVGMFVVLVTGRSLAIRAREITLARLGIDFVDALRQRLFEAISRAQWSFVAAQRVSRLAKALTSDVDEVAQGTYYFLEMPAATLMAVVQASLAFSVAPRLTLGVLLCGSGLAALIWYRRGNAYHAGRRAAGARRLTFDRMSDYLAALKLSKSHAAESRQREAFGQALRQQREHVLAMTRRQADGRFWLQVGAAATLGAVAYVGATIVNLRPAELLVLVVIVSRLMPFFSDLQQNAQHILHVLPVFSDLLTLVTGCEEAVEAGGDRQDEQLILQREIVLAGVSFAYDADAAGPDVLREVDLIIPARSITAIVGSSGAGKTTLADLLLGLLVPRAGSIRIDGQPLLDSRLASWRRSVAYVVQEPFLFHDTVRANLLWARPDASDDELRAALEATGAAAVVARMPDGLDAMVGERGSRLSGGERQRLALSRALVRQPTMLLLDEATSALDPESEQAMWDVIARLGRAMTIVVIAHRLSSVRVADRIVVLDHGRVVQAGSWHELMGDEDGRFAALARAGGWLDQQTSGTPLEKSPH